MSTDNEKWAVIFDVDGTMVDNARYHENAWIELGRRHNLGITAEFYRQKIHSRSNDKNVRLLFDNPDDELVNRIADEKESIYRDSYRPEVREIPGLKVLLAQLKSSSVPCAAASNSPKGNVDMVIDELGIRDHFEVIINRDDVEKGKPHPEIFLRCADKLGVPPCRCVVMEDSVSGFEAAKNAQMPCVAVTMGADPDCKSKAGAAAAVYPDFTDITPETLKALL